jgi:hypothetical protein
METVPGEDGTAIQGQPAKGSEFTASRRISFVYDAPRRLAAEALGISDKTVKREESGESLVTRRAAGVL